MIITTTILFGLARGMYEGMIMYGPGVREHEAFWLYHVLGVAMLVAFARVLYLLYDRRVRWWYLLGLVFILWESTEIGYAIARKDIPFLSHEHIAFLDIISVTVAGWQVWVLHAARCVGAVCCMLLKPPRNCESDHWLHI